MLHQRALIFLLLAFGCSAASPVKTISSGTAVSSGMALSTEIGAPGITGPTNQTILTNASATFMVTASGASPLSYGWTTNSVAADSTSNTLVLANVPIAWSNMSVQCWVTNLYGSATSAVAVLTVTNGVGTEVPSIYSVTNYGSPLALWLPDNALYSASSSNVCTNLPDSFVYAYSLTNAQQLDKGPSTLTNSLDGHHTLLFHGLGDYLRNVAYTNQNGNAVQEVWMVMAYRDSTNAANHRFFYGTENANRQIAFVSGADRSVDITAGTTLHGSSIAPLTNRWYVWRFVFNQAESSASTNNVTFSSGSAGTQNMCGFTLANTYNFNEGAPIEVAAVFSYSATNTTVARSAIYGIVTNFWPTVIASP